LYCPVTTKTLNKNVDQIEKHIKGPRFLKRKGTLLSSSLPFHFSYLSFLSLLFSPLLYSHYSDNVEQWEEEQRQEAERAKAAEAVDDAEKVWVPDLYPGEVSE
jgi:hypothetical protein